MRRRVSPTRPLETARGSHGVAIVASVVALGITAPVSAHPGPAPGVTGVLLWIAGSLAVMGVIGAAVYQVRALRREIAERRLIEAQLVDRAETEERLLRELDHRVRNNLTSLLGLIEMTRAHARDRDDFADAIRGRVMAISSVHSLLSRERWQGSSLYALLTTLIGEHPRQHVRLRGPEVAVPLAQSQAVGFVINELVTNSEKYGALSVPGGELTVIWRFVSGDDGTPLLELRWNEEGGPPITTPVRDGTGSDLVRGIVGSELQGRADLSYTPTGARHVLRIRFCDAATAQFRAARRA